MKSIFNTISAFILTLALSLITLFTPLVTNAAGGYSRGDGTVGDPYQIANCQQLQGIQNDLDAHYKLLVNIDCDGVAFESIGDADFPFTGSLDGDNKIIKNLQVAGSGMFGYITGASTEDLAVVQDILFLQPSVTGSDRVGTLAGTVTNGQISDVYAYNGYVEITSGPYAGGLIGQIATGSTVQTSAYKGDVVGSGVIGGFVGISTGNNYVQNNYAIATITVGTEFSSSIGGFMGSSASTNINNNYAVSTIDATVAGGNTNVGGFVGMAGSSTIQYSFADMTYTGSTDVGDFIGYAAGPSINTNYYGDHGHGCASNSANPGASACQAVEVGANPDYFWLSTNAPLNGWDFENTWQAAFEYYPMLIGEIGFSEGSENDINGDGISDNYQANVIGVPDAEENLTVVELDPESSCTLDPVGSWIDSGYYKEDPYYPLQIPKMTQFTVYCPNPGDQVQVTLIYPEEYDTSNSVIRFYNNVTNQYHNVSGVEFGTREVNGNTVTTATYLLVDGSINDTDGTVNGVIQDPVGIAVNNEPPQTNSSGSGSSSSLAETGSSAGILGIAGLALTSIALLVLSAPRLHRAIAK